MMNDSVREELQTKIANPRPAPVSKKPIAKPLVKAVPTPVVAVMKERQAPAMLPPAKLETAQLKNNHKTSPTLVGFQPKNATVPDWRLQLQNSVRGRKASPQAGSERSSDETFADQRMTSGANALKIQYSSPEPAPENSESHSDPRLAKALQRIAESRRTFLTEPQPGVERGDERQVQPKNFKFNVISRTSEPEARPGETRARVNVPPKPRLVASSAVSKKGYDTNKLPPLPEEEGISSIEMDPRPIEEPAVNMLAAAVKEPIRIADVSEELEPVISAETDSEEIDDLAPFSMRFNAGVFDLLIGAFASLILLSPLAFFGTNWFSTAGAVTFAATCAIVMFAYLTLCVGLFGKTVGMRMFSLELVDADESDYPTFHQAAVSSAAYLLTLPLAGIGFITVFFNDEKRAAHDLLSGTIIVMEF
jgi:uncharacterized RDD family membrane protein YckC